MEKHAMYYDTIVKLTTAISQCKDPEEVALITAESVKTAFNAKGCSVFLVNRETRELGLVASSGLSDEYLNKGPIHFMQTIREAKDAVPIAIYDVMDDPRIEILKNMRDGDSYKSHKWTPYEGVPASVDPSICDY